MFGCGIHKNNNDNYPCERCERELGKRAGADSKQKCDKDARRQLAGGSRIPRKDEWEQHGHSHTNGTDAHTRPSACWPPWMKTCQICHRVDGGSASEHCDHCDAFPATLRTDTTRSNHFIRYTSPATSPWPLLTDAFFEQICLFFIMIELLIICARVLGTAIL